MQLTGKVVLVTGAQQGIGTAMAREFAAGGADVAINWLDDEGAAQRVADQVCASGRRAILVRADVGQLEQVKAMVSAAHALVEAMLFIEREERRELLEPPNQAPQGLRLDRSRPGRFLRARRGWVSP
jgi:NAD(P)-dependent dehydrogenase (short-subunit alcohol dehydrogenase family)